METREQIVAFIARTLYARGMGSKAGARKAAEDIVDALILNGALVVAR